MTSTTSEAVGGAPISQIDIYNDASITDPVPMYHDLLAAGPVVWLEQLGMHAIVGHAEVTAALRNHRVFASGAGVSINDDINKLLIGSTLHSDPPAHDRTRAITFAPLTPKALSGVRVRIEAEAAALADRVTARTEFDAASELAPHLPLTIVRDLVGLGGHGKANMLDWGAATFELMGDAKSRRGQAIERMKALRGFLEDPQTLDGLAEDGWARRATQAGIEAGMEPSRAAELMRDYIAPSLDTTISAIGYAMMLLATHPDVWARLRADRALINPVIEETVRLNTPIKMFSRKLTDDIELGGVNLRRDGRVLIIYGAANRDPARFENPDTFDPDRNTRGHVGFGHGVHTCLGMHLARLEIACLLGALADRIARIELTGPAVPANNSTIHAFASVPVRVQAA